MFYSDKCDLEWAKVRSTQLETQKAHNATRIVGASVVKMLAPNLIPIWMRCHRRRMYRRHWIRRHPVLAHWTLFD